MAIFALKQTVDFYRNQDTTVYMCFLDVKNAFHELIIDPSKVTVEQKCDIAYCEIVYLLVQRARIYGTIG